ncbi:MAG TPA: glycoside hydrolase family 30 protein, partial [Steroidobacteraceae bacterium]
TTRDSGARWAADAPVPLAPRTPSMDKLSVRVDPRVRYQAVEGFGGAFTEAAATTLLKLPAAKQEEILRACFDPATGLGYTLCRTHINSCDFALGNYAYSEQDGDFNLKAFTIEHDRAALIPMIQRAKKIAGSGLKLFASPWSPPAWMKTTGKMNRGGQLKPECREVWASYYARYIQAYAGEGISIWGLTVQNEPEATQTWDSCTYTAEEERDFVRDHLGPTLVREGLGGVKIIIWDHNRDQLFERALVAYDDPEAAKYIWGAGFHWYTNDSFENVQRVHDAWPDKQLLFTEGCQEGGPHTGEWALGERYARSIIQDLNHWTVGWVDWNMLLDHTGGPNHVGNLCSAPILGDTRTGQIHYQNSYYYIGHFSRFIRPGAVRILVAPTHDDLECTAFAEPDGRIVVVILNRTETPRTFELRVGAESVAVEAPQRSIQTLVLADG